MHWTELVNLTVEDLIEEQGDFCNWIEKLIYNSTLGEYEKQFIESLNEPDLEDEMRDMIIEHLLLHQIDHISNGMNYDQTDIKRKLKIL